MPTDEAIRELLARFLFEFGSERSPYWWNYVEKHDEFYLWYQTWCHTKNENRSVEGTKGLGKYIRFIRKSTTFKITKAGLAFLKG
jgi:hypothetical protein